MSMRKTELSQILTRWLNRYSPPRSMAGDQQAQQDEAEALFRVLMKFAPDAEYVDWTNAVLDQLEYQMKTRAWPTKGELGAVCSNMRKQSGGKAAASATAQSGWGTDTYEIIGARMRRGDAVGEGYLYGREACEIIKRRLVTNETMAAYRSIAYLSRKQMYGGNSPCGGRSTPKTGTRPRRR